MCAAVSPSPTDTFGSGASISRSGRVRKKSSLLSGYESLDGIGFEKPRKKYNEREKAPKSREKSAHTPKVTLKIGGETPKRGIKKQPPKGKRMKLESMEMQIKSSNLHGHSMLDDDDDDDEEGDLEIDLPPEFEGDMPMLAAEEIIDEELLDEEDGATEIIENTSINRLKSQAESTYFMEKSMEKSRKIGGTHGTGPQGKVKQARKDKGSPRVTAYMLWAKEHRPQLPKQYPNLDFPGISKKLGELWATVPQNQKKLWKNKATKIMKKNANLSENMKNSAAPHKPPKLPKVPVDRPSPAKRHTKILNPQTTKEPSLNHTEKKQRKSPQTSTPAGASTIMKSPMKSPSSNRTTTPTVKGKMNSLTTNGKPSPSTIGASQIRSNNHENLTRGRQSPKAPGQSQANRTSASNSFALVSSEFTQQTNVQIRNDKKISSKGSINSNSSVNVSTIQTVSQTASSSRFLSPKHTQQYSPRKDEDSVFYKVTGTGPIDVAAHFSLLGESLTIIGERLKEHEGQTVSGSLSVLLDSLLCATGPLLCLTQQVPELNCIPPDQLNSILDNIAYIMPGL